MTLAHGNNAGGKLQFKTDDHKSVTKDRANSVLNPIGGKKSSLVRTKTMGSNTSGGGNIDLTQTIGGKPIKETNVKMKSSKSREYKLGKEHKAIRPMAAD